MKLEGHSHCQKNDVKRRDFCLYVAYPRSYEYGIGYEFSPKNQM